LDTSHSLNIRQQDRLLLIQDGLVGDRLAITRLSALSGNSAKLYYNVSFNPISSITCCQRPVASTFVPPKTDYLSFFVKNTNEMQLR